MSWDSSALRRTKIPYIDLHERRRREREQIFLQSRRQGLLLVALLLFMGMVLTPLTLIAANLHARTLSFRRGTVKLRRNSRAETETIAQIDVQLGRWNRLTASRERRKAWQTLAQALAVTIPSGVYLEQFQCDAKEEREIGTLQGSAESIEALTAFVNGLARMPLFTKVSLTETTADHTFGKNGLHFKIETLGSGTLSPASAN